MKKIAVFGSAFNPPSLGHKNVLESLTHFDLVLLEPSIAHAWGKDMLDYSLRCELVDAFIKDLTLKQVQRSAVEPALYQPGHSVTTYALLERLQELYPDDNITFVIGPDNFFHFSKFYNAEKITRRWAVMVCPQQVHVRSTDVREAIDFQRDLSKLTTPSVIKLLREKGLYKKITPRV